MQAKAHGPLPSIYEPEIDLYLPHGGPFQGCWSLQDVSARGGAQHSTGAGLLAANGADAAVIECRRHTAAPSVAARWWGDEPGRGGTGTPPEDDARVEVGRGRDRDGGMRM